MSLVENIYRNYGDFVLHVPRWEISDQGTTAICGPSGSGKTTLFRVLIGLEPCKGWSWTWQDEDLAQLKVEQRQLGVVFQSLELYPHMTARENIEFAALCRRKDHRQVQVDIQKLADDLMIGAVLNKGVHQLSGGEECCS
jgi:ABC-type sugar transport system ATPase subunit